MVGLPASWLSLITKKLMLLAKRVKWDGKGSPRRIAPVARQGRGNSGFTAADSVGRKENRMAFRGL
jgi:hypothetical protein